MEKNSIEPRESPTPPKYNVGDVVEFYEKLWKKVKLWGVVDDVFHNYEGDISWHYLVGDCMNPSGKMPRCMLGSLEEELWEQDILRKVE